MLSTANPTWNCLGLNSALFDEMKTSICLGQATALCGIKWNKRAEADKNNVMKIIWKGQEGQRKNNRGGTAVIIVPGNAILR
jgi:hypothetical protein